MCRTHHFIAIQKFQLAFYIILVYVTNFPRSYSPPLLFAQFYWFNLKEICEILRVYLGTVT